MFVEGLVLHKAVFIYESFHESQITKLKVRKYLQPEVYKLYT